MFFPSSARYSIAHLLPIQQQIVLSSKASAPSRKKTGLSTSTMVLHALNALVGALCIAILGLNSHGVVLKDRVEVGVVAPENVESVTVSLLMWVGAGGIVDTLLLLAGLVVTRSRKGEQRANPRRSTIYLNGLVFVATVIFLRPFVVQVYSEVQFSRASRSYDASPSSEFLTPETWSCAVAGSGRGGAAAESLCRELRASRYLLIPTMILGAIIFGMVGWMRVSEFRREGIVGKDVVEVKSVETDLEV
ncbi:hypothetical protein BDV95DRAFT_578261 [Massariosphaeria phaeospora]|uniref:Uncharacterized protein n=1 Tax=Massariosphaeria phaeospora TaxID=100035 RepID=A0A7C8MGS8_9PLEO|nr:hypothetical protein BDV95DRAFT_578261 [Massariosphaeria phaeospora]